MKKINIRPLLQKIVSVRVIFIRAIYLILIFIGNYSVAHEIFINMNQNYNGDKELTERQNQLNAINKAKKCDDKKIICQKIFRIPEKKFGQIDSNTLRKEFYSVLDKIKPGEHIDSLVISAHSDGIFFSSKDANNPNFIELDGISALFNSLKEKKSKYLNPKLSASGNNAEMQIAEDKLMDYRSKFKPESLILMSCYSLEDKKNIATWFKSIDSLKFILGSTNVWPLAGTPVSKKLTEESLNLRKLILENGTDPKEVESYFLSKFSPLTRSNHNVSLALRMNESSENSLDNSEIINYRQIQLENGSSAAIALESVSWDTGNVGKQGTRDLADHDAVVVGVRAIRAVNAGPKSEGSAN